MANPKEEQRRRMAELLRLRAEESRMRAEPQTLTSDSRPPDELNVRARSRRKGHVTADKWNQ
jgi:hypothetical protein